MTKSTDCTSTHCSAPALPTEDIAAELSTLSGWTLQDNAITKTFTFKNYFQTIAFVNAVAWIAHQTNHHPDLSVGYNRCTVRFTTHEARGLTKNDFISAQKVDALSCSVSL